MGLFVFKQEQGLDLLGMNLRSKLPDSVGFREV
jgi:hypothetical protein